MKVRSIEAYTSSYSTNKTSQNKTKNTIAFRMKLDIRSNEAKDGIKALVGKKGFSIIARIVYTIWNDYENMLKRFKMVADEEGYTDFDPKKLKNYFSTKLCPSFRRQNDGTLEVFLMDNNYNSHSLMKSQKQEPDGVGVSKTLLKKNPIKAIEEALDNALNDYARNRVLEYYRKELKKDSVFIVT